MATMFDLLNRPAGQSPLNTPVSNLSDDQQKLLHQARSLCALLMELTNPLADMPVAWEVSHDSLNGTAWLLRDLIDQAGRAPEMEGV